uniref:Uncharacterized protein n=1 Tax=Rhizophora mucronata TaxID=61149 RepID=A0A2P2J0V6_RHIMU
MSKQTKKPITEKTQNKLIIYSDKRTKKYLKAGLFEASCFRQKVRERKRRN